MKVLINSGAEIDAVNDQGYSALLWATENQHSDVADYLLDQGNLLRGIVIWSGAARSVVQKPYSPLHNKF